MKNTNYILLSLLCCMLIYASHAQDFPKKGDYVQINQIDHFAGNWKWQSGDSIVQVQLRKGIRLLPGLEITIDEINGDIRFTIGSISIEDSFLAEVRPLMGSRLPEGNLPFRDIVLVYLSRPGKKGGEVSLTCVDNDCNTLQWELRESPGLKVHIEGEPLPQDFLLPRRMVLTREAPARRPQGN